MAQPHATRLGPLALMVKGSSGLPSAMVASTEMVAAAHTAAHC